MVSQFADMTESSRLAQASGAAVGRAANLARTNRALLVPMWVGPPARSSRFATSLTTPPWHPHHE